MAEWWKFFFSLRRKCIFFQMASVEAVTCSHGTYLWSEKDLDLLRTKEVVLISLSFAIETRLHIFVAQCDICFESRYFEQVMTSFSLKNSDHGDRTWPCIQLDAPYLQNSSCGKNDDGWRQSICGLDLTRNGTSYESGSSHKKLPIWARIISMPVP